MKTSKKKHTFKVLISDGSTSREYSFALNDKVLIQDLADTIAKKYKVKPKLIFNNLSEDFSGMER